MKRLLAVVSTFGLASAAAVLGLAGSGTAAVETAAANCTNYYVVSAWGPANPFMAAEAKGVADAGKDLGIKAVFSGPSGTDGSVPQLVSLLRSAVASHPCGIATMMADPKALTAPIDDALKRKIPVVLWNAQYFQPKDPGIAKLQYIGQDETVSGEKLGQHLAPLLHSGDTVVYGMDFPGELVGTFRYQGVKKALAAHGIKTVLLNVGSDSTAGVSILDSYISSHGGIKAIVSNGIPSAQAAVNYAKKKGKGKYLLASFDMGPQIASAIKQGYQSFALDQQPYLQGYLAIVALYKMNQGFAAFSANTGSLFVDNSNVSSFDKLVAAGIGS